MCYDDYYYKATIDMSFIESVTINISQLNCLFSSFCTCTFQINAHIRPFTCCSTYTLAFKSISNKHKLPYVLSQRYNSSLACST